MKKKSEKKNNKKTDNSVPKHIDGKAWRNNGEAEKQTDNKQNEHSSDS